MSAISGREAALTYNGSVTVGGPAQVRELPDLVISKIALGPMANNAYLLRCSRSGAGVLIDAPGSADDLLTFIGEEPISAVIVTHGHLDHYQALAEFVAATGVPVWCHTGDADVLPVRPDRTLQHGERIRVGGAELSVIHLRGHTDGSIALAYDDPTGHAHLFTGDSLFPGGVGNTWDDPQRFQTLLGDVTDHIFAVFDDEAWVYPGHGDDTVLGRERPHLMEWQERGW